MEANVVRNLTPNFVLKTLRLNAEVIKGVVQFIKYEVRATSVGPIIGITLSDGNLNKVYPLAPEGCENFLTDANGKDVIEVTLKIYGFNTKKYCIDRYKVIYSGVCDIIGDPQLPGNEFGDIGVSSQIVLIPSNIVERKNDNSVTSNVLADMDCDDIFLEEDAYPIAKLSSYDPYQKIVVKVIHKSTINTNRLGYAGLSLKIVFMDVLGSKVVGLFTNDAAIAYGESFAIGDVIELYNFKVKAGFRATNSIDRTELLVTLDSKVNKRDNEVGFTNLNYALIESIRCITARTLSKVVDIVAFIRAVPVKESFSRRTAYTILKLEDDSGAKIKAFVHESIRITDIRRYDIIILTNMKITNYKQRLCLFSTEYTRLIESIPVNRRYRISKYIKDHHIRYADKCLKDFIDNSLKLPPNVTKDIHTCTLDLKLAELTDIGRICSCRLLSCNREIAERDHTMAANCNFKQWEWKGICIWKDQSAELRVPIQGNYMFKLLFKRPGLLLNNIFPFTKETIEENKQAIMGWRYKIKLRAQRIDSGIDYSIITLECV